MCHLFTPGLNQNLITEDSRKAKLTFLGWKSYFTQCWKPFPFDLRDVMIKQLPTKWAEYPMPLLVRKLKKKQTKNTHNVLKNIFLINQTLLTNIIESTHLSAFCRYLKSYILHLHSPTMWLSNYDKVKSAQKKGRVAAWTDCIDLTNTQNLSTRLCWLFLCILGMNKLFPLCGHFVYSYTTFKAPHHHHHHPLVPSDINRPCCHGW